MKLLCLCSSLDLGYGYGCTPAWWQLFKGLYELGHEVIAVPYQGAAIETPWWRVYPNPCQWEGSAFAKVKKLLGSGPTSTSEGVGATVTKTAIESWIRPRWQSHVASILEAEKDVGAVLVVSIPLNHFTGLPSAVRQRFQVPFYYYDGDVPASLPRFGGFASGFQIYEGGDLTEYDGVICNSEGGAADLVTMGAKKVETVHWGADPDLFQAIPVSQDRDVFFYGLGVEYREKWIEAMLIEPSLTLSEHSFVVGGRGFGKNMGNVKLAGPIPSSALRRECGRSRINLNITRDPHASVFASSSTRLFELAALGCCIITNPIQGLEKWFDCENDILTVSTAEEAKVIYKRLLSDEGIRRSMGNALRKRVLEQHTYRHRAAQLVKFVGH